MQPVTREQVENLKVGDLVSVTFDTAWGKLLPGARWSKPYPVTEIFGRGDDVKGKAFACFYRKWGSEHSTMSGSVKEGDVHVRVLP